MHKLGVLIVSVLFFGTKATKNENNLESPYILQSESLPDDLNFMPTLGNGHLGFTIYGDSIFVNGIYNGKGGLSHRARIQNIANISVIPMGNGKAFTKNSYKLDLYNGIFERKQSNSEIETTIRTYAHRYYNRALITEIFVQRIQANTLAGNSQHLKLHIDIQPGPNSDDFDPERSDDRKVMFCQKTREMENPNFQSFKLRVCIAVNLCQEYVDMAPNETSLYLRSIVAIGESSAVAMKEMIAVSKEEDLLSTHTKQWNEFWEQFHIDLDGDLELSRTINAGIFYIASSLPSPVTNQRPAPYFGLSPTGLGRGNLEDDYLGHNFWDTEIWMLPAVTQLSTNWTRDLLDYRFRMLDAAISHANQTGFSGARFPWESAFTGTEVTNPCCPEVATNEFHITADIAFAVRHYFAITNDTQWMKQKGCELTKRIAEFWMSRVSWNDKTDLFEIRDVMGPDEDHENVTNNVFTNAVVQIALRFIDESKTICETEPSFVSECLKIANKLTILYDDELDYNPQYEGYTPNVTIKQADAILLSYPLLYPLNRSTISNNLRIYEKNTRSTGPAMTWSMHAIGHLDEGNLSRAHELFEKGYKDYVREPFKVWSEVIRGEKGAANFITGIGGLLQAIINGYGGIRFHPDRMEINKPTSLPGTKSTIISGIKYQGSLLTVTLTNNPTLRMDFLKSGSMLCLISNNQKEILMTEGVQYALQSNVYIRTC